MFEIEVTNTFKKDLDKSKKHGKNITKFIGIVDKLCNEEKIPSKNKDHQLKGDMKDYRELHIEPDWLLIYQIDKTNNVLKLIGLGTHSELF